MSLDKISISGSAAPTTSDRPFTPAYRVGTPKTKPMTPTVVHHIAPSHESHQPTESKKLGWNDFALGNIAVFHAPPPPAAPRPPPQPDSGFFSLTEVSIPSPRFESKPVFVPPPPPPPLPPAPAPVTAPAPIVSPPAVQIKPLDPLPRPSAPLAPPPPPPHKLPPVPAPVNFNPYNPFAPTKKPGVSRRSSSTPATLPPRAPVVPRIPMPRSPTKTMVINHPPPSPSAFSDLPTPAPFICPPSRGQLLTPSSLTSSTMARPSTGYFSEAGESVSTEGSSGDGEDALMIHELELSLRAEREARAKDREQLMQLQSRQQELISLLSQQGLIPAARPPSAPIVSSARPYSSNSEFMAQRLQDAERELRQLRDVVGQLHGKMSGTIINHSENPLIPQNGNASVDLTARSSKPKGPSFRTKLVFDHKGNVIIR